MRIAAVYAAKVILLINVERARQRTLLPSDKERSGAPPDLPANDTDKTEQRELAVNFPAGRLLWLMLLKGNYPTCQPSLKLLVNPSWFDEWPAL